MEKEIKITIENKDNKEMNTEIFLSNEEFAKMFSL